MTNGRLTTLDHLLGLLDNSPPATAAAALTRLLEDVGSPATCRRTEGGELALSQAALRLLLVMVRGQGASEGAGILVERRAEAVERRRVASEKFAIEARARARPQCRTGGGNHEG